jgi:hypothetical protein
MYNIQILLKRIYLIFLNPNKIAQRVKQKWEIFNDDHPPTPNPNNHTSQNIFRVDSSSDTELFHQFFPKLQNTLFYILFYSCI